MCVLRMSLFIRRVHVDDAELLRSTIDRRGHNTSGAKIDSQFHPAGATLCNRSALVRVVGSPRHLQYTPAVPHSLQSDLQNGPERFERFLGKLVGIEFAHGGGEQAE